MVSTMNRAAILLNSPTMSPIPPSSSPAIKEGQSGRKVQMFGKRAHAARKAGPAIPLQHFLSAWAKEDDSQHDTSDRHDPVSVSAG
jgi:hypothetical protein